ncbi:ExbD/TolR family protein [Shimia sp.]|uniref:ExbD/TolR family protein n=1 Tax=Shimia sp. TaxID=1954381 RepID=UPI003BA97365
MQIEKPKRRVRGESIVPMINVVFLLLIFFLMTSRLAEPTPFKITPPNAKVDAKPVAEAVVFLSEKGILSFDGQEGEAALIKLLAQSAKASVIRVRADQNVPSNIAAKTLSDLAAAGMSKVELIVVPQ